MVRRLVKKGYLGRRRSRVDARRYAVQLTEEGRKALERALPIARNLETESASRLPEKQRQHFFTALQRILDKPEKDTNAG